MKPNVLKIHNYSYDVICKFHISFDLTLLNIRLLNQVEDTFLIIRHVFYVLKNLLTALF